MNQQLATPSQTTLSFRYGHEFGQGMLSVHRHFSTVIRTFTLDATEPFPKFRIHEIRITDVVTTDLLSGTKYSTRLITTTVGTVKLTHFGAIVDVKSKTGFKPTKVEFPGV